MKLIWVTPDRFDRKPDKSSWLEMARHLQRAGHQVTILTSGRRTDEVRRHEALVTVVGALDLALLFRVTALFNMLRWLRRHAEPEAIIIVNPDALWLLLPLRLLGLRRVHLDVRTLPVEVHGLKDRIDQLLFWSLPLKWLGKAPASYSFITERLRCEVEKTVGGDIADYVIWQSGVNGNQFAPQGPGNEHPHRQRRRLFYHGTVTINRGIDNVLKALALADPALNVEFVIVGDGSGAAELKTVARRLGLEERVLFKGLLAYDQMAGEINSADLCICPLPNRLEWNVSSPLKVFEYMACGKPMVLTPIAPHLEVLAGAPFVVWSEACGSEPLCRAIEKAFADLPSLTRAAAAGPALVAARHEWARQAERLEHYLLQPKSARMQWA